MKRILGIIYNLYISLGWNTNTPIYYNLNRNKNHLTSIIIYIEFLYSNIMSRKIYINNFFHQPIKIKIDK